MTCAYPKKLGIPLILLILSAASPSLTAAVETGYSYLSSAALQRSGISFNANQEKAAECYNSLVGTNPSAASAGYYTYLSTSYVQYFSNFGQFYFNAFYADGFVDVQNIGYYASQAGTYADYYNSVAISYRDAYSSLTTPSGSSNAEIAVSASQLNGFLSQNAYELTSEIEGEIASQFGGSNFQYSLIYYGVASGLQDFYTYLARQFYQSYLAVGDAASGLAYGNFYLNYGVTSTRTYSALGAYYFNLTIAYE